MYRRPSQKQATLRRFFIYALMVFTVLVVVSGLTLVVLGYQLDRQAGKLEQTALLQFASTPGGATVSVDGNNLSGRTPTKTTVFSGSHIFDVTKSGYEPWTKTLTIKSGTLTWLNYVLLVPKSRQPSTVFTYPHLAASLASPNRHSILVQPDATTPVFDSVAITSSKPVQTVITIPSTSYAVGGTQQFKPIAFDSSGRYVLVWHSTGTLTEWLVVDTQDPAKTVNVSNLFGLDFTSLQFAGTGGTVLYGLSDGELHRLDLSADTLSSVLASHVTNFSVYGGSTITYTGTTADGSQRLVGLYRDGDMGPSVLKTLTAGDTDTLTVASTNYFNDNYVVITTGTHVDTLSGDYPSAGTGGNLRTYASFDLPFAPSSVSFSSSGDYLNLANGNQFAGYDIEYKLLSSSELGSAPQAPTTTTLAWLDDAHLYADQGGQLTIRDFDGTNVTAIGAVTTGQAVTLSQDNTYLYNFNKKSNGTYQLERVRMILP